MTYNPEWRKGFSFGTVAVSGQDNIVADADPDTLTLTAGSNITLTTDAATDTLTITGSGSGGPSFGTIAVSGQSDVVAGAGSATLTLVAGSNVTLTTDAGTDSVTITAAGSASVLTIPIHAAAPTALTLTNQAVAGQFLANNNRNITRYDLTGYTEAKLVARVVTGSVSVNSPRLRVMYDLVSGGFSTAIANFTDIGNAGEVSCSMTTAGVIDSGWLAISATAQADVYLAVSQIGGDAAADPVLGPVTLYFR